MNIGERLRDLRNQKGLTQVGLSIQLNVSQETISSYERNNIIPSLDILIMIANYFDVSLDYLVGIDPVKKRIDEKALTPFELSLLSNFRKLSAEKQELSIKMVSLFLDFDERK